MQAIYNYGHLGLALYLIGILCCAIIMMVRLGSFRHNPYVLNLIILIGWPLALIVWVVYRYRLASRRRTYRKHY